MEEKIPERLLTLKESQALFASKSPENKEIQFISDVVCNMVGALFDERLNQGMSQRDFAKLLKWKQPALVRIETLDVIPRLDTFAKMLYHLGGTIKIEFPNSKAKEKELCKKNTVSK